MTSVINALARALDAFPNRVALRFLDYSDGTVTVRSHTYRQLWDEIAVAAAHLPGTPGDRVLPLIPGDDRLLILILGAMYRGMIPIPVPFPITRGPETERLHHIITDSSPTVVIADDTTATSLDLASLTPSSQILSPDELTEPTDVDEPVPTGSDTPAFLQYTSGSTGHPKGVLNDHRALAYQAEFVANGLEPGELLSMVSWLPLHHDMGLIYGALVPLINSGTTTLMLPASFLADPLRWVTGMETYHANYTASPDFGYGLVGKTLMRSPDFRADLSSLKFAIDGSEPISPLTIGGFRKLSAERLNLDPRALTPCYGLAEASLAVCAAPGLGPRRGPQPITAFSAAQLGRGRAIPATADEEATHLVSVGTYTLRTGVTIVDPETHRALPDGVIGEIWLSGPGIPPGYWRHEDATEETFRAHLVGDSNTEHLRTGDLGVLHEGHLYITGRAKDLIIHRGVNIYPQDVEQTLRSLPEVPTRRVCIAQRPVNGVERTVVIVEATTGASPNDPAVAAIVPACRQAILDVHGLPVDDVVVAAPHAILWTTSGKVRRSATVDAYLRGELPILFESRGQAPTSGIETLDDLIAVLTRMLGTPITEEDLDANILSLGLTSVQAAELAAGLTAGGHHVTYRELFATPNLRAWSRLLSQKRCAPEAVAGPVDPTLPFPTTPIQQAYLFGRSPDAPLGGVGCHSYMEFRTHDLDPARLSTAWNALLRRHPMLRAVFDDDNTQRVLESVTARTVTINDLTNAGDRIEDELKAVRAAISHRVLDVAAGQNLELELTLLPNGEQRLHVDIDLLVADATSITILLEDLAIAYDQGPDALEEHPYPFSRYLAVTAPAASRRREAARRYWEKRMDSLPGAPALPVDITTVTGSPRFTRRSTRLSQARWTRLRNRARAVGLAPSAVLLTCYAAVMSRYSGDASPFSINLTTFERQMVHPDVATMVADFTENVLVACTPTSGQGFLDAARTMQKQVIESLEHADHSGVQVLRELAHTNRADAGAVVFTSSLGSDALGTRTTRLLGYPVEVLSQTPQVWIDHQVMEQDGELLLSWDAVEDLFPSGFLDAAFDSYSHLVNSLVDDDWDDPIHLPLPDDQAGIRQAVNETASPITPRLLHEAFFEPADRGPRRTALLTGDGTRLTYGEVADGALRTAAWLRGRGVVDGDVIGVTLPRGPEQIIAVLGVLAAGAIYVPMSTTHPQARRTAAFQQAGVDLVVDSLEEAWGTEPLNTPVPITPEQAAYIIFTSGSSGEPKGVEISHRSAWNTLDDVCTRFGITQEDRGLAVSALDFDLSVFDIFGLLGRGGSLVLLRDEDQRDAEEWSRLVTSMGVTVWNSAPILLDMLLTTLEARPSDSLGLRLVLESGDWVGLDLPGRLRSLCPDARFVALGGATEAAVWSNYEEVDVVDPSWRSIPYGRPLSNQQLRVVTPNMLDCPVWVAGDLLIGGDGVAHGYRNSPALTAAAFSRDGDGISWYRTGDRARYLPDGRVEFLGRTDLQVKVRGHRIELGGIESVLANHPDVNNAVVVVHRGAGHELAAAVTVNGAVDEPTLLNWLRERLPAYEVPAVVLVLPTLPLTRNGKVDRAAVATLTRGLSATSTENDAPPEGPYEEYVAALWEEFLSVPVTSRAASFFELGGDSLTATRMATRIRSEEGADLPLRDLFLDPTLAGTARALERSGLVLPSSTMPDDEYEEGEL